MNLPDLYRGPEREQIVDIGIGTDKSADDRVDLRGIVNTLRRHTWLILICTAIVFLLSIIITITQSPQYTARARVMLDVTSGDVAPAAGQTREPSATSDGAIDTELELIRSRGLGAQVVRKLNLMNDPEFNLRLAPPKSQNIFKKSWSGIDNLMFRAMPQDAQRQGDRSVRPGDATLDAVTDKVLAGLQTQRVGVSYAIDLYYTGRDPAKSARIADAFASLYTTYKLDQKVAENQQAITLLGGRIEELRQQAERDTAAVQQYRIANNLLSSSGASLTEQEISAYNQQVTGARAQVAEDSARLATAKSQLLSGSAGDDVGEALNSPVVQSLRSQRASVSSRVAELTGRYGPRHPDIITAQRELTDIDSQIQAEINRVISNLDAKLAVSTQRLRSLQGSLGGAQNSLRDNNQAMVRLDELTRKASASQSLYETYLTRLGQSAAQEGTLQSDSRVISTARRPTSPSSPNIGLNLLLGLVLGLGSGLVAAFLAEMLSTSVATADDVEQRLGRPYLGSIPTVSTIEGAGNDPINSILTYPRSAYAEAFRSLRTSLQFAGSGNPQVTLVTSSLPQEGKTTTSIGLARSAALHGRRVIIIDTDLRRRGVNRLAPNTKAAIGILEVLADPTLLDAALQEDDESGAMILPVGKKATDTAEYLTGPPMDDLLARLRETFDTIIIDAPPLLPIAEARILATKADALIFVVRWRKTAEQAIRTAFRLLPRGQVRFAGVVLTRVDMRKQARYGYGDAAYYYKQYKNYYA